MGGVLLVSGLALGQTPSSRTPTTFHGRLEIVYLGTPQWDGTGYPNEIGGFIDDGYFDSNLAGGIGSYGLFNTQWPDYWIYGLNLSVGYRSSSDASPHLRDVLHNGNKYTGNPYATTGQAQWTISYYNNTTAPGQMWKGDGPHPILDGNIGDWPNVSPNPDDRRIDNPFDPETDNPYETVAWGTVQSLHTTYTRYDAQGRAPGDPGYDSTTAGFENGGYTIRHERITLVDAYEGGVWDFGPASPPSTLCDENSPGGLGWGPTYVLEATLYHDPRNISGLFGGVDVYGHPYVWTGTSTSGDLITYWYEPIPEPSTGVLAGLGLMGFLSFLGVRR